jgi:hypothetical protein
MIVAMHHRSVPTERTCTTAKVWRAMDRRANRCGDDALALLPPGYVARRDLGLGGNREVGWGRKIRRHQGGMNQADIPIALVTRTHCLVLAGGGLRDASSGPALASHSPRQEGSPRAA